MTGEEINKEIALTFLNWKLVSGGYLRENGTTVKFGEWNPINNLEQALKLVDMLRQTYFVEMVSGVDLKYIVLIYDKGKPISTGINKKLARAICKAIINLKKVKDK